MIRRVVVDYARKHPPGTLIIRADRKGRITYERDKRPNTRRKEFNRGKDNE